MKKVVVRRYDDVHAMRQQATTGSGRPGARGPILPPPNERCETDMLVTPEQAERMVKVLGEAFYVRDRFGNIIEVDA